MIWNFSIYCVNVLARVEAYEIFCAINYDWVRKMWDIKE